MRIDGPVSAQIGDTESTAKHRLPVADNKNRGARSVTRLQRRKDGINLAGTSLTGS